MRVPIAVLLLAAACAPLEAPPSERGPEAERPADTAPSEDRAGAAGLSPEQRVRLVALGEPVYVPDLPDGWALAGFHATALEHGGLVFFEYRLVYRAPDGTCAAVEAASEGLGDVWAVEPPHARPVPIAGVPTYGDVRLGWSDRPDPEQGTPGPFAATDWMGTDGLHVGVRTGDDGCAYTGPDAVEALARSLRPLDPADDAVLLGPLARVEEFTMEIAGMGALVVDPEAVARLAFGPAEPGEGRQATAAETLRRTDRFAVVLVTTTDLADDSVRDERVRAALGRGLGGWFVRAAGRQVRCQPGRGAQDWTAGRCR